MDFDDFEKYDMLSGEDEPHQQRNIPRSNGNGCIPIIMIALTTILLAFLI